MSTLRVDRFALNPADAHRLRVVALTIGLTSTVAGDWLDIELPADAADRPSPEMIAAFEGLALALRDGERQRLADGRALAAMWRSDLAPA